MRRILNLTLVVALLIVTVGILGVSAQSISPWTTGIDLQNLSSNPATVVVDFYNAAGTLAFTYSSSTPVAAGGSLNVYLPNLTGLNPGTYSGVISSDQTIAVVASLNSYSSGNPEFGGGDIYLGTSAPANNLVFPLVYRNHTVRHWYTTLVIQNTSSANQTVTLKLYNSGNTTPAVTKAQLIPANASFSFNMQDSAYAAFGPFGSATVDGTAPLAGVASNILLGRMTNPATNYLDTISSDYRAFTTSQFGQDVVLPLVYKNYNSWTTGINVVDPNTAGTAVHITYTSANPSLPGTWNQVVNVAGHAMQSVYTPSTANLPNGFYGSATLHADSATIAVVVASQRYLSSGAQGVAYEGSKPSDATRCASLPVTHNRTTWKTGINILNMGAAQTLTLKYHSSATGIPNGTDQQVPVGAGKPVSIYMPSAGNTQVGFYGAVEIKGTQPFLVNVANARSDLGSHGVASNYVAINYVCP